MKKISTQLLGTTLFGSGIALLAWASPLILSGFNWASIGAFSITAAVAILVAVAGRRILLGHKISDVLRDLFTGLGK